MSQQDYSAKIKKRFPNFDKEWNKLVHEFGIEFVNSLKKQFNSEKSFLGQLAQFKLKMVIDNNFIFGEIKGALKKNKEIKNSFLYKLMVSTSVEIFAPPKLKEELLDKITSILPEADREIALKYSMLLLPKITIKDAQWIEDWKKANNLIGKTDSDDVPYLALAFETGSHAIMSYDKVFHKQGEINVWKHQETDSIITNYNSGFISFLLLGQAGGLLVKLLVILFKLLRDILLEFVEFVILLAEGAINAISKIPPPILLALIGLGIIYRDELYEAGKDFFTMLKQKGSEIVKEVLKMIKEIYALLESTIEIAKLGATVSFEFLGFLLNEYSDMNDKLKELKFDKGIDFRGSVTPSSSS